MFAGIFIRGATGVGVLRTAKFSKIHIKSNFDAVKKSSPFLKRSRAKEFQKNAKKNLKLFLLVENYIFQNLRFKIINFTDLIKDWTGFPLESAFSRN